MGENGGCLQSCQKCCFKRFKSVHTQATVLQSCQLKLLTLNLFKRCETKQLRTNFIDNSRVMLQKKNNKMADAVEEVNKSQNVLGQFKFKFKFKYFNVCCWNNHVLLLYHSTLGNIPMHIWGHCYQQQVSGACIHNHILQITVWCDYLSMPWQNLYAAGKEFTGACMKMGWKTFPSNIHPPGPHNELCLWRNIREELVQSSLSNL